MSDKYLIDKASLVALADITRAYNQTPEKEYTLAEVTEQVREASDAFFNIAREGLTNFYSDTSSAIRLSGISRQTEPYMNLNLPKVSTLGKYAFREDKINKIYMSSLQTTSTYAFHTATFFRGACFPSLTETKSNDFASCTFYGSVYLPNIVTLYPTTFGRSTWEGYLILKKPPTLSGVPTASNWGNIKIFVPLGATGTFSNATNWAAAIARVDEFREATTYEEDFEDVWKMLVEDGHLTEEEIRRDFYAEG